MLAGKYMLIHHSVDINRDSNQKIKQVLYNWKQLLLCSVERFKALHQSKILNIAVRLVIDFSL